MLHELLMELTGLQRLTGQPPLKTSPPEADRATSTEELSPKANRAAFSPELMPEGDKRVSNEGLID